MCQACGECTIWKATNVSRSVVAHILFFPTSVPFVVPAVIVKLGVVVDIDIWISAAEDKIEIVIVTLVLLAGSKLADQ